MDWDCKYCGETVSRSNRDALKEAVKDHVCDDDEHRRLAADDFRRSYSGSECRESDCRHVFREPDGENGGSGFECPECGRDHARWYVGYAFAFGKSEFGTS